MIHKLDANENPFGCSLKVKKLFETFDRSHIYADPRAEDLKRVIGKKYGLDPQNILCGAGSEDLITTLIRTFCKTPEDEIIIPKHSFILYEKAASITGSKIVNVGYDDQWRISIDEIIDSITPQTKLICLDHPGNPIGTFIPYEKLKHLIETVPSTVMILIDSAYAEYAYRCEGYNDGMDFPLTFPNVFVTRTLSKVYGLAGLRIGWLYASAQIMEQLNMQRVLYKASRIAQEAAIVALSDDAFAQKSIEYTVHALKEAEDFYTSHGLLLCQNVGNFLTLKFESAQKAQCYYNYLLQNQIKASLLMDYHLDNMIRISIGNPDAMKLLFTLSVDYDFNQ